MNKGNAETRSIPSRPARGIHSNAPSRYPVLRVSFHPHRGTWYPLVTSQFGTAPIDTVNEKEYNAHLASMQREKRGNEDLTG